MSLFTNLDQTLITQHYFVCCIYQRCCYTCSTLSMQYKFTDRHTHTQETSQAANVQCLGVLRVRHVGNVGRRNAIIGHSTGHEVAQHLGGIRSVQTQLTQLLQE